MSASMQPPIPARAQASRVAANGSATLAWEPSSPTRPSPRTLPHPVAGRDSTGAADRPRGISSATPHRDLERIDRAGGHHPGGEPNTASPMLSGSRSARSRCRASTGTWTSFTPRILAASAMLRCAAGRGAAPRRCVSAQPAAPAGLWGRRAVWGARRIGPPITAGRPGRLNPWSTPSP